MGITEVIKPLNADKAPSLDGYDGFFFKSNWEVIKVDIIKVVTSFSSTGKLLREVNRTFVVLIHKEKIPRV